MANMATWGPQTIAVSASVIASLEKLTTSLELKQDSENDTSGTQPTNTRGRKLRPVSFKVTYLAAAGTNPRREIKAWEDLLGYAYPLIIGGERFGPEKMKLTGVATSEVLLSVTGSFLKAVVTLTMEEYSEGKSSKLLSGNTGGTASTTAAEKAAATYAATVAAKTEALKATASKADKLNKSAKTRMVEAIK